MKNQIVKMFALMVLALVIALPSQAQEKSKTKDKDKKKEVVVVKKKKSNTEDIEVEETNKNGKSEVMVKIVENGEVNVYKAESYDDLPDNVKAKLDKVNAKMSSKNGKEVEIVEIDEIEDMPDDVKEKLEKMEIVIEKDVDEDNDEEKKVIKKRIIVKDGNETVEILGDDDKKMKKKIIIMSDGDQTMELLGDELELDGDDVKIIIKKGDNSMNWNHDNHDMAFFSDDDHMVKIMGGKDKGFLGVSPGEETSDKGFLIGKVIEKSAAEKAGLKAGDIITKIGDKKVADFDALAAALEDYKPEDDIVVAYIREGQEKSANVTLGTHSQNTFTFDKDMHFDHDFEWHEDGDNTFFFEGKGMNRPMLGVLIDEDDTDTKGITISGVSDDSGAKKAGLQKGDVITAVNGTAVNTVKDIHKALDGKNADDVVKVSYTRDGANKEADVKLSAGATAKVFKSKDFYKMDGDNVVVIKRGNKDEKHEIVKDVRVMAGEDAFNLSLDIFPNPAENNVTVKFEADAKATTVSLMDVTGKQIFREELKDFNGEFEKKIDVSNSADGILILTIIQGEHVHTEKIMKK